MDLLAAILRRVDALPELGMQVGGLSSLLLSSAPNDGAFVLDQIVRGAINSDPRSSAAMLSVTALLLGMGQEGREAWDEALGRIYEASAQEGRDLVTYLFLDLPPHRVLENRKSLQGPRFERDVSLGERKQMARGVDRGVIDRLLLDLDPSVLQKLCANPRIREQDILKVCTRRPNMPEALEEIVRSHRWLINGNVRFAVLCNPYAATGLGLKMLPTLRTQEIRDVARALDLHPAISQTAGRLLSLRRDQRRGGA